jgi:hypothetical protein
MPEQALLKVFQDLIRDNAIPLLVLFHKSKSQDPPAPFTEILQSEYNGKLRLFEFNLNQSRQIMSHYHLPEMETAVIFENGKTHPYLHGYRNVRNYLRAMMNL